MIIKSWALVRLFRFIPPSSFCYLFHIIDYELLLLLLLCPEQKLVQKALKSSRQKSSLYDRLVPPSSEKLSTVWHRPKKKEKNKTATNKATTHPGRVIIRLLPAIYINAVSFIFAPPAGQRHRQQQQQLFSV